MHRHPFSTGRQLRNLGRTNQWIIFGTLGFTRFKQPTALETCSTGQTAIIEIDSILPDGGSIRGLKQIGRPEQSPTRSPFCDGRQ